MQKIFSRNQDIDKIAFLNWRIEPNNGIRNLLNLAEGYMLSSIKLAKLCLINNNDKCADILIFPILANANHGIELYLKAIMWILNRLLNSESKVEGGHNIKQIFETVRSKIRTHHGSATVKDFDRITSDLQEYIAELFELINVTSKKDNMDFSRYPFTTDYEEHFYVNKIGNVEVDLENFVQRFEKINDTLENISDHLYYTELNYEE